MPFSLTQTVMNLPTTLSARLHGEDTWFNNISTDTRTLQPGDVFIALQGPHFDGHDYVQQALQMGAVAAMVTQLVAINIPQLIVSDTHFALGELAKMRIQTLSGIKIAVTGSCGKTTVKEMLSKVLAQAGTVQVTQGNLNNAIGVPLTVWRMQPEKIDYRVFELGASHVGEIAHTSHIVNPDIAILTNAQASHLSGFGGYEGVVKAKGEIVASLHDAGQAVLNLDDENYAYWKSIAGACKVWSFSVDNPKATVSTKQLVLNKQSSQFTLVIDDKQCQAVLPLAGQHNVQNALAAAAAACAAGVSIEHIVQGLAQCQPYQGRMVWHRLPDDAWVIDDSYNANPASVKAAIDVLAKQPEKRCLVFGDMGELGDQAIVLHQQIGQYAAAHNIDYFITLGPLSQVSAKAYLAQKGHNAIATMSFDELTQQLQSLAAIKINYLVKGSRSSRMERAVHYLLDQEI